MLFNFQESISNLSRQFKNNKKTSHKEKYKVAQGIHERLKQIIEDVSELLEISVFNLIANYMPICFPIVPNSKYILFISLLASAWSSRCIFVAIVRDKAFGLPANQCQKSFVFNDGRRKRETLWKSPNPILKGRYKVTICMNLQNYSFLPMLFLNLNFLPRIYNGN